MPKSSGGNLVRGSLWLRPTGPVLDRLQELIRRLTARFGGSWPKPHVSLLGGIEITSADAQSKLALLAERLRPITIRLGRLEGRNEHFRCFYAAVQLSPQLEEAHYTARQIFGVQAGDGFSPHLSLLYGQIDEPAKLRLAQELGGRLDLSFTVNSVHLVNAAAAVPVSAWHTLYECKFSGASSGKRPSAPSLNA